MSQRDSTRSRRHSPGEPLVFDDGVAAERPSGRGRLRRKDRKALQLCRQVAETLDLVLSGECDDELLRSLRVVQAIPEPDASQLLILVAPALPGEALDPLLVQQRLAAASGRLRCEVAAAITRRRAPRLRFQFIADEN
ncbi:MAG: ribosome-binding factor A [Planctomycetales bacterium]